MMFKPVYPLLFTSLFLFICSACVSVTFQNPNTTQPAMQKPTVVVIQITPTVVLAPYDKALQLLQNVPEIKQIMQAVEREGRKPFFTKEETNGAVVNLSLRESFPEDAHTSRIDTFTVDTDSGMVTVWDVISDEQIDFTVWKTTVAERFPKT